MNDGNKPRSLLDGLSDIANDFWGAVPGNPESAPLPNTSPRPETSPVYAAKPTLPPFIELWKVADEPVDWTEALASPTPTDGLTAPKRWALYHQHAANVLRGDTAAYLAVLQAANPMADLMPYVTALDVSTVDADTLRAGFTVRADLLKSDGREYLAGMSLRIARDLFAVLPVTSVNVTAKQADTTLLHVSFQRSELYKVRFAFIDPVAFVQESGGVFGED